MIDERARSDRQPTYVLGHSGAELERLERQARLVDPITRRFLLAAGIAPGMRILDVGSGAGDVAILAADLVGATGEVTGIDRSAAALARARARTARLALLNVSFREGDVHGQKFDRPFDAVIGRYVLMFQSDPTATLRELIAHVRPGGVVAFHEPDWDGFRARPAFPAYLRARDWIVEAMRRSGADPHMGLRLHAVFTGAGLPPPEMRVESLMGGGPTAVEPMRRIADIVTTLAPEIERLGIATQREMDVETLARRMAQEGAACGGAVVGISEIGAWSRA